MCLHVAANLHILDIRTMTLDFWNMVNFEVKLFRYYEGKIMNYLKEIMWIAAFTFVGEVLNNLLPLPVPAGVYGMLLLLFALMIGIVKLPDVEGAGNFLLDMMTMMFLPAAVGIMSVTDILGPVLIPYVVIVVVSTILVMAVTGLTTSVVLKRTESKKSQRLEQEEISLEPHETFGIGRRALSPNGEIDGANGYREIIDEKRDKRMTAEKEKEVDA